MERHEYLFAISGIENAQTEWQHAAHKVVAVAVDHFTLRIVEARMSWMPMQMTMDAYCPTPMAAIEQQSIDDVKLQHQTEEQYGPGQMILSGFSSTLLNMPNIDMISST